MVDAAIAPVDDEGVTVPDGPMFFLTCDGPYDAGNTLSEIIDLQPEAIAVMWVVSPQELVVQPKPPTVTELLAASRVAHDEYRRATSHMVKQGARNVIVAGDPVAAKAALQRAYDLRLQAHEQDVKGEDPSWKAEPGTFLHDELLAWYLKMLGEK